MNKATAQGTEQPRRRMSFGRRLKWGLVITAILIGVIYLTQVVHCSQFTPTGDDLYDRYARAVIKDQAWKLYSGDTFPAVLSDAVLAEWVDEFGDDPRYWQLRYWSALHGDYSLFTDLDWGEAPLRREQAYSYLEQARQRGVADAETLQLLHASRQQSWRNELKSIHDEEPGNYLEAATRIEADELTALNDMITADPDNAWSFYLRANYWFSLGEMDLAVADLATGNAAPDCFLAKAFPAGFVYDQLAEGKSAGSPILAGAIIQGDLNEPMTNWIRWKESSKELLVTAALGGDTAPLTEMHHFACRIGTMDRGNNIATRLGSQIAGDQALYVLTEIGDDLSPEQRRSLVHVTSMDSRLTRSIAWWQAKQVERSLGKYLMDLKLHVKGRGISHVMAESRHPLHRLGGLLQYAELHLPWRYYLQAQRTYQAEHEHYSKYIGPTIEEMAGLDYASLEYSEEWSHIV